MPIASPQLLDMTHRKQSVLILFQETYSNARGVTASTPFNRKKEVTKEQGVWHIYSYPAVCCDS